MHFGVAVLSALATSSCALRSRGPERATSLSEQLQLVMHEEPMNALLSRFRLRRQAYGGFISFQKSATGLSLIVSSVLIAWRNLPSRDS